MIETTAEKQTEKTETSIVQVGHGTFALSIKRRLFLPDKALTVKVSANPNVLLDEAETLRFLQVYVDCKLHTFFLCGNTEFFFTWNGVSFWCFDRYFVAVLEKQEKA